MLKVGSPSFNDVSMPSMKFGAPELLEVEAPGAVDAGGALAADEVGADDDGVARPPPAFMQAAAAVRQDAMPTQRQARVMRSKALDIINSAKKSTWLTYSYNPVGK